MRELNVPAVPVYIKGAFHAWPRGKRFPRIKPIKIVFGKSVYCSEILAHGKQSVLNEYEVLVQMLRNEVIRLSSE